MKTFKLIKFFIPDKSGELLQVPFEDSLIINKENEKHQWLIELFIEKEYLPHFERYSKEEEFFVEVVITNPENPPAGFMMKLETLKIIDNYASVLMEGSLNRKQSMFAEQLLKNLVSSGLSGDDLVKNFNERMKTKEL